METITLGSFSIDDDQPVKIQTKEHTIAPPKTKKLKNALIDLHLPDMQISKVKPTKAKASSNPEDAKQHQDYVIMISRYGTSPRFSDYLKTLTFKLDIPSLKRLSVRDWKNYFNVCAPRFRTEPFLISGVQPFSELFQRLKM